MRRFFLSLLILTLTTVANGQVQRGKLKDHPTLKIVNFQWMATGGDSYPGWSDGSSNGGIFPNTSNWGVARGGDGFGSTIRSGGTPFYCRATIKLKNAGGKTIRAVYLDYVFRDQATGGEFLRYQFAENKRIRPGDTTTLDQHIYQKSGKHRNAFLPVRPSRDAVLRTKNVAPEVVIRRIEYADGTAQQY